MSAYRLVDAQKASYPVSLLYAGYFGSLKEWLLRLEGPSALKEGSGKCAPHAQDPQEVHDRSPRTYTTATRGGAYAELRALGVYAAPGNGGCPIDAQGRSARICIRGRRKCTTRRDKNATPAADLVQRNFSADAPQDRIWTADITYISALRRTFSSWLFCLRSIPGRWLAGRWQPTSEPTLEPSL